jgi:DNA helicase IV
MASVELEAEQRALDEARQAAADKLAELQTIELMAADELSQEYMEAVVRGAVEKLSRELTVFGRIDDDEVWRVGIYGVQKDHTPVVIDWRAPFSAAFYQARFEDPLGLSRRVSYVGAIDELFVEEFETGEVSGSSPLMAELSRSRGQTMKTAVATLQSEQDELVRRDPDDVMVIRGGPGTGKTVVGLHRAAWIVYNDQRLLSAELILVVGPTDRYLQYVSSVLPTLGEAKVRQTTLARLLGATSAIGAAIDWPTVLDRFEASLYNRAEVMIRRKRVPVEVSTEILDRVAASRLPWRKKRAGVVAGLTRFSERPEAQVRDAAAELMPPMSAAQAFKRLRNREVLAHCGLTEAEIDQWLAVDDDGPLRDELKARFEQPPMQYSHVIIDEAQDLTQMQMRAVQRRSKGLTFVGDDAQTSVPGAIGLKSIAESLDIDATELTTAYRMSAEIAVWLNELATRTELPAVELVGIRPTGTPVRTEESFASAEARFGEAYDNWRVLRHGDVWTHKGIEYDAVLVDATDMTPAELYLAASRAAHELVVTGELNF